MAGGRKVTPPAPAGLYLPQWSPGLMAGGSRCDGPLLDGGHGAAMEPRPDGRGKRT